MRASLGPTLLLLALSLPARAAGGGLVVGIVGVWHDGAGKPVRFGEALDDKQDVICPGAGSLTLLLRNTGQPETLRCASAGARTSVKEFAERNAHGGVSEFFGRLFELIRPELGHEPKSYIAAVSRGFGDPEPDEAVLRVDGNRVDVAPALVSAPAGVYQLTFFPVNEERPDSTAVSVKWTPGSAAWLGAPEQKGVVKMALLTDGAMSSFAWVLLTPPAAFDRISSQFAEARQVVSQWPGRAHAPASRSVLRAYLRVLSAGGQPRTDAQ